MPIIIIEGPDLSGKSYAIEKIAKHFNSGFVLKNSFKPRTLDDTPKIYAQYWDIINLVTSYTEDEDRLVILDRFFPSQAVYSYMRGEDHMNKTEIIHLDRYAREKLFLYVYLDTSYRDLEARYNVRGDEHIDASDLMKLKNRYDTFFENTTMNKIKVNTLENNWLEKLEAWINEYR